MIMDLPGIFDAVIGVIFIIWAVRIALKEL
jgi:hypothetical protein